jgi:hypothetical protein
MNARLSATTLNVDSFECIVYHHQASLTALDVSMLEFSSTGAETPVTEPATDIRTFVRQLFIHGIPYKEVMRYDDSAVSTLLYMLADPQEKQFWSNIVFVLGMLGNERAVAPLISFIERNPTEKLDYSEYDAKVNAVFALGYLINKNANRDAMAYLEEGLDPSTWSNRGITWSAPDEATELQRNRELSRAAIIALGLSGNRAGEQALRELARPAPTAAASAFREEMSRVISEALKANERIAKEGLARYYQE